MVLPKHDSLPVFSTSENKKYFPTLVYELFKGFIILLWKRGARCMGVTVSEIGSVGELAGGGQRENGFNFPTRKPGDKYQ